MSPFNFEDLRKVLDEEMQLVHNSTELERVRVKFLGRKGVIAQASRAFGSLEDPEEKRRYGRAFGIFKTYAEQIIAEMDAVFEARELQQAFDVTMPGSRLFAGGLHPLTVVLNEVIDIFRGMGFAVETGPEAESVYYNFDALNTPAWHPARDLTDTMYIDLDTDKGLKWVLRTETSPIQIRTMERQKPPIRIIAPGRVYRKDKPDATHSPVFMQVEGLYVDKGVDFADLKGTVLAFYRALYGQQVRTRFRPHFFPFTEPSAEVDISCPFCGGKGCRICKNSGWLEMGGSGMVDPNVLQGVNIDPEVYTGWAFGLGIERIALLRYGIDDIRLLYDNDLRFLGQFC